MSEQKKEDLGERIIEICLGIVIGGAILVLNLLWMIPAIKKAFE